MGTRQGRRKHHRHLLKPPVYAGDFFESRGHITATGKTFGTLAFEAYKVIATQPDVGPSAAATWHPVLVARAAGNRVTLAQPKRR
jgi:hypothetical protein